MTPAVKALQRAGVAFELHEYEHDETARRIRLRLTGVLNRFNAGYYHR